MKIVNSGTKKFDALLSSITSRGESDSSSVEESVKAIIERVRRDGDKALVEYTMEFDGVKLRRSDIRLCSKKMKKAAEAIPKADLELLKLAAKRIEAFHKKQLQPSFYDVDEKGTTLGQKVTALKSVGIYVPGGKASYPSSVLMNAIPAKVAGVKEIYMVTPPGKDGIDPYVLAAAYVAGVKAVFQVGGAQAVAALSIGTKTVPRVAKIVGPGNIYVATAKRLVFGLVDIDMIAGPSEILVIGDGTGNPAWIAADLLSQAEHDELASAILVTTSKAEAKSVELEVAKQLKRLKRARIAKDSIERYGAIIVTKSLKEAARISNSIAPEHLELFVDKPFELMDEITNAGAIFLGPYSPEAVGDYLAGPNHTLPTGGTARFSSPLGVYDFVKRSSVISFSREGFLEIDRDVKRFADLEGFSGHARSAAIRRSPKS
ncbi:MAG: histidinol dehydrogenase [Proteobacteria bacterium]|nr:histidinol dehydrogenase [Pseudomonadota bacterium]